MSTITFVVTDNNGVSASVSLPLTLVVPPPPLAITTTSLPAATVGVAYSFQMAASGGVTPYGWTATGLPAGLSCSTTGLISGTPT